MAAHKTGAVSLVASAFWIIMIRTFLWDVSYNRGIFRADVLIVLLALVFLILAGAFWLRDPRGFLAALSVSSLTIVWLVASGYIAGFLWLMDYPLITLQLLVIYFSLRAYSDVQKAKAGAAHPMDYPVFG